MALKDKVKGFFSFLDTDDANELEELEEIPVSPEPQSPFVERPRQFEGRRDVPTARPQDSVSPDRKPEGQQQYTQARSSSIHARREELRQTAKTNDRVVIDLKYPRTYDDAQGIVDLLVENESVLIDFQYMTDAQARRCLDFIDGASKVLFGHLNYVGSTMYLLTPANVVVNLNDLAIPESGQDLSYDYDMKRR